MGVNMIDFRPGTFVSTKDGVGRILFFTDYKPITVDGHIVIRPISAVVLFDNCSANKYPMDQITMAEQPQKVPSSELAETVERTSTDVSPITSDARGQAE
jgi:hypothetical protein